MKCPKCGNTDVNKMIVWYLVTRHERVFEGATTLSRFLYETVHPKTRKNAENIVELPDEDGKFHPFRILKIEKITCDGRYKNRYCGTEIKPTRYGV